MPNIQRCSYIHNGVTDLTSANRKICDQHVQLTSSRISCDNKDIAIVKDWFDLHTTFNRHEPNLKSISSGLIADLE